MAKIFGMQKIILYVVDCSYLHWFIEKCAQFCGKINFRIFEQKAVLSVQYKICTLKIGLRLWNLRAP